MNISQMASRWSLLNVRRTRVFLRILNCIFFDIFAIRNRTRPLQTQPVTPRTLETLIRFSTAHAKARMSATVTAEDARAAIELVQYAYFKRVLEKEKKRRRRDDDSEEEEEDEGERPKRTRQVGLVIIIIMCFICL